MWRPSSCRSGGSRERRLTGPRRRIGSSSSAPDEGGEDVQESKENGSGFGGGGGRSLEFEEIETGEALDGGSTCDGVVADAIASRAARTFRDIERDAQAGTIELVGVEAVE